MGRYPTVTILHATVRNVGGPVVRAYRHFDEYLAAHLELQDTVLSLAEGDARYRWCPDHDSNVGPSA